MASGTLRSIALLHAFPGDTNDDFTIDDVDLNRLLTNFGLTDVVGGSHGGDFDEDTIVGDGDLNVLLSEFGTGGFATTSDAIGAPEPTSLTVLSIVMVLVCGRRRQ